MTFEYQEGPVLSSESCDEIKKVVASINQWASRIGNKSCEIKESDFNGRCIAKIKGCFPSRIENVLGKTPSKHGPNCHNFAFAAVGLTESIRHTNYRESMFLFNSPLCRELKLDQKPRPGDIGRIGVDMGSAHSFIHIDDDYILSKNGEMASEFNIFEKEKIINLYGVKNSKGCLENKYRRNGECRDGILYYRCTPFDDYISKNNITTKYMDALNQIRQLEDISECRSLEGQEINPYETKNLVADTLIILNKYLEEEMNKILLDKSSGEEERFLISNLLYRIRSLEDQASQFDPEFGFVSDYSVNNSSPETGLPISENLDGRWRRGLEAKEKKKDSAKNTWFGI